MIAAVRRHGWLWAGVLLTLAKLWLTRGQPICAIGSATHDDQLFIRLAESIARSEWLGPYDQLTLAKGPFYSVWIALTFLLGLPLGFAQQLLYAAACLLLVVALAPLVRSQAARLAAYALLLWNPMSFDGAFLSRVLRQQVSTPLALMILAGLVALVARREQPFRRLVPWAVLAGIAFGLFWVTREEGVWIVPGVVLLGAAAVVGAAGSRPGGWRAMAGAGALAAGVALVPVAGVCVLNAWHYRWYGTVEFRAGEFKEAYGALLRVRAGPAMPFVPVTRQAREAIYAVSPAFALLRPHLEGSIGEGWAGASASVTHLPAEERQISGGWFMWALRDATAAAGFCQDAGQAMAFYHRLAMEVNQACDDGRLPAGPRRSGFLPPWHPGLAGEWLRATGEFAEYLAWFRGFSAHAPPSVGSVDELEPFRVMTRDRLSPPVYDAQPPPPLRNSLDEWKVDALQTIGRALRSVCLWLVLAAHGLALARLVQLVWRRRLTYAFVVAAAAWSGCAATVLMDALIQVTSFPVFSAIYLHAAYPLLLLFVIALGIDVATDPRVLPSRREP